MDGSDSESDATGILASLSINVTPSTAAGKGRKSQHGGPSKRSGRHSVAPDGAGPMTLREQEQVCTYSDFKLTEQELDAVKKDNFNLQLENHFLKERLANMAPDHIEAALKENVKLKLEILNLSKEMKKIKKLLLQQDRDLADAQRDRDSAPGLGKGGAKGEAKEMERLYREEKERRRAAEGEVRKMEEELGEVDEWKHRTEQAEAELDQLKAQVDDLSEELARATDLADRAQDEVERVKNERNEKNERGDVSVDRGREARLRQRVKDMEEENARLGDEVERLGREGGDTEELEEVSGRVYAWTRYRLLMSQRVNDLRDKLAAAQLDLDRRDQEIDELNAELDAKIREHEKEIGQVEAEWRDEVLQTREQVDELKDVSACRVVWYGMGTRLMTGSRIA